MARGIGLKTIKGSGAKSKIVERGRSRALFTSDKVQLAVRSRPPCSYCAGNRGVWSCWKFQGISVKDRWIFAKKRYFLLETSSFTKLS